MSTDKPDRTLFYTIEQAIKMYRRYAQTQLSKVNADLTVDQALVLQFLYGKGDLSQVELARLLFKKDASVTRMVEILVRKKFLVRDIDSQDRRKSKLRITAKGMACMEGIGKIIVSNRKNALFGISDKEQQQLYDLLQKIIKNCQT